MLRLVSRLASKPPLRPAISLASASCKARFSDKAVSVTSKTKNALEPAVKHTIIPIEYSCSISFVSEKVADIHKKVQHTYQILILRIRAMARDKFSGGDSSLETGGYCIFLFLREKSQQRVLSAKTLANIEREVE